MHTQYLNAIYSVFSYEMRRYAGISISPPLPPAISVELSSVCNLACPECVTGAGLLRRKNDFMDYSLAEKISGELRSCILSAWLYWQGEPMLHPRFFEIVKLFRGVKTVISTNGHFLGEENCRQLVESGLDKIIISYDGITPESYNMYRIGGDHSKVTEGIKRLAEINKRNGSRLKIELQFLLHRHNEHEVKEAAAFAGSVNAGFKVKSMQVLDTGRAENWMPSDIRKARYIKKNGKWVIARAPARGCIRMWTTPVITTDGDVLPCCYDKLALYSMGNLNDQTFINIWYGEKYRSFRDTLMRSRSSSDICSLCPQGKRILFRLS